MPKLSIVSERSEADLRRSAAARMVEAAARDLATNIMRIARGAGKPEQLIEQVRSYESAAQRFFDAFGRWPGSELRRYLDLDMKISIENNRERAWHRAQEQMLRGSLRIAASRLSGQNAQESAGVQEMFDGFREIERQRAENRRAVTPEKPKT